MNGVYRASWVDPAAAFLFPIHHHMQLEAYHATILRMRVTRQLAALEKEATKRLTQTKAQVWSARVAPVDVPDMVAPQELSFATGVRLRLHQAALNHGASRRHGREPMISTCVGWIA